MRAERKSSQAKLVKAIVDVLNRCGFGRECNRTRLR
jgi:hypothetical protein